jgi:hypothetical protein
MTHPKPLFASLALAVLVLIVGAVGWFALSLFQPLKGDGEGNVQLANDLFKAAVGFLNGYRALAGEPADAETARQQIVAEAVKQEAAEREAALAPWIDRMEQLAAREDLDELQFLGEFERLVRDMPADLLTPENIARMAEVREGAMGAAALNALQDAVAKAPEAGS